MAKFISTHTPPVESKHVFEFTQREVDVLMNVLHDLVRSDGVIKMGDEAYTPNTETHTDLSNILFALDGAGMSLDNDYLSNFLEVVL